MLENKPEGKLKIDTDIIEQRCFYFRPTFWRSRLIRAENVVKTLKVRAENVVKTAEVRAENVIKTLEVRTENVIKNA